MKMQLAVMAYDLLSTLEALNSTGIYNEQFLEGLAYPVSDKLLSYEVQITSAETGAKISPTDLNLTGQDEAQLQEATIAMLYQAIEILQQNTVS